jgi:hypothetical protein
MPIVVHYLFCSVLWNYLEFKGFTWGYCCSVLAVF